MGGEKPGSFGGKAWGGDRIWGGEFGSGTAAHHSGIWIPLDESLGRIFSLVGSTPPGILASDNTQCVPVCQYIHPIF